jgi:DNA-binding HxlR family transcriptional regulator
MKSHGQFCPVAQALDVVGDRWTLLVVRELMSGSRRFSEVLNGVPKMPRSVLAQRLKQLEDSGILEREEASGGVQYELTDAGRALESIVLGLGLWSRRWAHRTLRDEELDASLLLWDMRRRIDPSSTPSGRVLVRFDFADGPRGERRYWLKITGQNIDCDHCMASRQPLTRNGRGIRRLSERWSASLATFDPPTTATRPPRAATLA